MFHTDRLRQRERVCSQLVKKCTNKCSSFSNPNKRLFSTAQFYLVDINSCASVKTVLIPYIHLDVQAVSLSTVKKDKL